MNRNWKFALAVLTVFLGTVLIYTGALQLDHILWKADMGGWDYQHAKETPWIPELGISVKDAIILFFGFIFAGEGLIVALLVFLLASRGRKNHGAEHQKEANRKVNSNFLNHNGGPTMKDALIIALVLTLGTYFSFFLLGWTAEMIETETTRFLYESIRYLGSSFLTEFILLAGFNHYTKKKVEEKDG